MNEDASPASSSAALDYKALAEALPNLIFLTDEHGHLLYANKRLQDFTGLDLHATQKVNWLAVFHPDDHEGVNEVWHASISTGEPYESEHRIRAGDGEYRWFLLRGSVIRSGDHARQWVGFCSDIDDQKEAEKRKLAEHDSALATLRNLAIAKIAETDAHLRNILFNSGILCTAIANLDGSVSDINEPFLKMLGKTSAAFSAGQINLRESTAAEHRPRDDAAIAELIQDGICKAYQKEFLAGETRRPVKILLALLNPENPFGSHLVLAVALPAP